MAWATVDALFLLLPFSGPGSGAMRLAYAGNTGRQLTQTVFQLSRVGVAASAIWGYITTIAHSLTELNISFASSSSGTGGGSGSGSAARSGPGGKAQFEYSEGSGDWYSNAEGWTAGSPFQTARIGKPSGWIYWLDGTKFDAFRSLAKQLVEAKNAGYEFLLSQDWFYEPAAGKSISGADALVLQARKGIRIANAHGLEYVIEVKGRPAANAIRNWLAGEGVPLGPGGANIVTIP